MPEFCRKVEGRGGSTGHAALTAALNAFEWPDELRTNDWQRFGQEARP